MTPFGFRSHAGGPFEQLPTDGVRRRRLAVRRDLRPRRRRRRPALARRAAWRVLAAALTPVQLVFAIGFAFPFLLLGLPIRVVLLALARPSLR